MNYYFDRNNIKFFKNLKSVSLDYILCSHCEKIRVSSERETKKFLLIYLEKLYLWKLISQRRLVLEIRKYLELNNETTPYQSMWDAGKTLLSERIFS